MESFDYGGLLNAVGQTVSTWSLKAVGALALLVIGTMVAKMVRSAVRKALERSRIDNTLVPFLTKLVYYLLLAFIVLAVLNLFGVQNTSFIALLGAAGLAVGLALQGTLSNFAAGVMLLVFRPFQLGDFIDAGGTAGTVKEIGIFATTLHSPDNVRIIVPNSSVYGQTIKNYSTNETRRNDMVVSVSYDDDLSKAAEIIQRVVVADDRVLSDPMPKIAVSEMADSSINFVVRPWCTKDDYWDLRFDLTKKLKEELEAGGCSIPYPQRDVHMQPLERVSAA